MRLVSFGKVARLCAAYEEFAGSAAAETDIAESDSVFFILADQAGVE
jgi:hypothetical protein